MKIALIGNSHLAALKLAADADGSFALDVSIDWFAGTGERMEALELRDGKLVTDNKRLRDQMRAFSSGEPEIDLSAYDRFVLVGLGLGLTTLSRALSGFANARTSPNARGLALISDACLHDLNHDLIRNSVSMHLVRLIRQVSLAPIAVVSAPFWSRDILELPGTLSHMLKLRSNDLTDTHGNYICAAQNIIGATKKYNIPFAARGEF